MTSVKNHIEQYLTDYNSAKSVTPIWCDTCKSWAHKKCIKDIKSPKKAVEKINRIVNTDPVIDKFIPFLFSSLIKNLTKSS